MEIENVIICDSVRKEDSGKHALIGVYPKDIRVGAFPFRLQFDVWFQIPVEKSGDLPIELRVVNSKKEVLYWARGYITVNEKDLGLGTVTIPKVSFDVSEETELVFQIREPKKRWQNLKTLPLSLRKGK